MTAINFHVKYVISSVITVTVHFYFQYIFAGIIINEINTGIKILTI